ncbi:hypothetical protein [Acinetobacter johnsonii]|uniref:Protein FilF n=1 Tax=Acinetobacter johnsonii TaxID=40214 RepID=A0A380TSN6_ACIJO|nr:hypothetical protein [Acinetobacter johnsonii]ENU39926.1 hypothetical protein F986_01322 [Acinetobacter johnsonii CIP 64.6]QPS03028.1 hypothetical protein I6G67_12435 [Acinetobacter johnsonii]SUT90527.1 Uncharacterised protein [Acinetobacter johnsonii]
MNKSLISILITATLGLSQSYAMTALNDEELAEVEGQALMNLEYTAGSNGTDSLGQSYTQSDLGFYKLGLSAEIELNANIKKLQLGCGGSNNTIKAGCDIDIDNLSLSGLPEAGKERPETSAKLTNPFIEFAIKNPTSAATREVMGFRVSAEKIVGLLTAGTNDGTQNGINTLSGYMKIAPATGSTKTQETPFTQSLTGKVNIAGCLNCPREFVTSNSTIKIPSMPVNFTTKEAILNGSRLTSVNVNALADVPTIILTENSGNMKAVVPGTTWVTIIPLSNFTINDMRVNMQISGLKTDIALNQSLGLIHSLPLNNPVSLSLQKSKLFWPKEQAVADPGWWLAVNDPVQLGTLNASENYAVDINPILPDVATYLSDWFDDHPLYVDFGSAVSALFTSKLVSNVGEVNLGSLPALPLPLNNIPLGASQNVISNCYGGLKFC